MTLLYCQQRRLPCAVTQPPSARLESDCHYIGLTRRRVRMLLVSMTTRCRCRGGAGAAEGHGQGRHAEGRPGVGQGRHQARRQAHDDGHSRCSPAGTCRPAGAGNNTTPGSAECSIAPVLLGLRPRASTQRNLIPRTPGRHRCCWLPLAQAQMGDVVSTLQLMCLRCRCSWRTCRRTSRT